MTGLARGVNAQVVTPHTMAAFGSAHARVHAPSLTSLLARDAVAGPARRLVTAGLRRVRRHRARRPTGVAASSPVRFGALGRPEAIAGVAAVADCTPRSVPGSRGSRMRATLVDAIRPAPDLVLVADPSRGGPADLDDRTIDVLVACERMGVRTVLVAEHPEALETRVAAVVCAVASDDAAVLAAATGMVGPERVIRLPIALGPEDLAPAPLPRDPPARVLVLPGDGATDIDAALRARGVATVGDPSSGPEAAAVAVLAGGDCGRERSRQVVGLVASGVAVVGPSSAPPGLAPLFATRVDAGTPEVLVDAAAALLEAPGRREVAAVAGRRAVRRDHAARPWLDALAAGSGLPVSAPDLVSIVVAMTDPATLDATVANVARQEHRPVELVVVADSTVARALDDRLTARRFTARFVGVPSRAGPPARRSAGLRAARGRWVAWFDEAGLYGPHHIGDLLLAAEVTGADLVGKVDHHVRDPATGRIARVGAGEAERPVRRVPSGTALVRADRARVVGFAGTPDATGGTAEMRAAVATAYSTHRFDVLRRAPIGPDAGHATSGETTIDEVFPFGDAGVPFPLGALREAP